MRAIVPLPAIQPAAKLKGNHYDDWKRKSSAATLKEMSIALQQPFTNAVRICCINACAPEAVQVAGK